MSDEGTLDNMTDEELVRRLGHEVEMTLLGIDTKRTDEGDVFAFLATSELANLVHAIDEYIGLKDVVSEGYPYPPPTDEEEDLR